MTSRFRFRPSWQIYEHGAAALGQSGIGWQSGPLLNLADLGKLGDALLSAPTVGAALRAFERFLRFIQSETDMRLTVKDGVATLSYRILNPDIWPRRQDAEFTLSVLTQLIRRGAGQSWRPDLICFEHTTARSLSSWGEVTGQFVSVRLRDQFTELSRKCAERADAAR